MFDAEIAAAFADRIAAVDDDEDLLGVGLEWDPATVMAAYASGVFPMGVGDHGANPIGWWSPNPRGIVAGARPHISRSLVRRLRNLTVTFDQDFDAVIRACADERRDGRWITDDVIDTYTQLHQLGWVHSVEVWAGNDLVGGLYGVHIGSLFAGESMFHQATGASKVAMVAAGALLEPLPQKVFDVQWCTDHLATMGVVEVPRDHYIAISTEASRQDLHAGVRRWQELSARGPAHVRVTDQRTSAVELDYRAPG